MIRFAEKSDLVLLLELGEAFFEESGYSKDLKFDKDSLVQTLCTLIDKQWLITDGESCALGFAVTPLFFNNKESMAQELFWYVTPEARAKGKGKQLLEAVEGYCKGLGLKCMMMLHLEEIGGDAVGDLYKSLGYKPKEKLFMKVL